MIYYLKRPPCKTIGDYINVSCWKLFEFEKTEDTKKEGLKYTQGLLNIIVASNLSSPYILTDVMNGFYSKLKIDTTENEKEILDRPEGILKGMETISIADSCYLKEKHGRLVLFANLQVNSLDLVYKGRIKVASFYPMISISGSLSYVNFIVEISADARNGSLGALHKFLIESFDGLNIEVQGLWPLNLLVKALIEATKICYKSFIKRHIEHQVRRYINQELDSFTFPIRHKENFDSVSKSSDPDSVSRSSDPDSVSRSSDPDSTIRFSDPDSTNRSSYMDTISRCSYPDSISRCSYPDSISRSSYPDSISRSSYPDSISRSSYPDSISRSSYPDSISRSLYPDSISMSSYPPRTFK